MTCLRRLSRAGPRYKYNTETLAAPTVTIPAYCPLRTMTTPKRPRSPFLPACRNCARSGVLPNSLDSENNLFCTQECAISSSWSSSSPEPAANDNDNERNLIRMKTAHELIIEQRLECANRQRIQMLLKKQARTRRRRNSSNNATSVLIHGNADTKVNPVLKPQEEELNGLLVFTHFYEE